MRMLIENSTVASCRLGIAQYLENALCEVFIDLGVTGYRLGNIRDGIVIPIVLSAVATNKQPPASSCLMRSLRFTEGSARQAYECLEFHRW
jgi:hypothetical protein